MLDVRRAIGNSSLLRSLMGLNAEQFEELHASFSIEFSHRRQDTTAERKRKHGAGRKHTLQNSEAMLFFIFFYFRAYPTMELAGFLFGVAKSQICTWVKTLQPVLEAVLNKTQDLPARKIASMKEFVQQFPEVQKVVVYASERPCNRPQNKEKTTDLLHNS